MNKNEVISIIEKVLEIEGFDGNTVQDLREIGMDSLLFIRLVVEIEEHFEIEIDDEDLLMDNFITLDNILQVVSKYV